VNKALRLVEDLREAGIVGKKASSTPKVVSKVVPRALDPQDESDVREAFDAAEAALKTLAETLLRVGPPASVGATQLLAYLRNQLGEMEGTLGLRESVEKSPHHDFVNTARIQIQKTQGLLDDAARILAERRG
jgi:hypothetical protein